MAATCNAFLSCVPILQYIYDSINSETNVLNSFKRNARCAPEGLVSIKHHAKHQEQREGNIIQLTDDYKIRVRFKDNSKHVLPLKRRVTG